MWGNKMNHQIVVWTYLSGGVSNFLETLQCIVKQGGRITMRRLAMVFTGSSNRRVSRFNSSEGFGTGQKDFSYRAEDVFT